MSGKEQHIDVLTQSIVQVFRRCERAMQLLGASNTVGIDCVLRTNVIKGAVSEIQQLSAEFRKQQKNYLQNLQIQQDRYVKPSAPRPNSSSCLDGGLLSEDKLHSTADNDSGFTEQQQQQLQHYDDVSIERDTEIKKIVESVGELAGVMKDLSVLVVDQGSVLDRIDYNIEHIATSIDTGRQEIDKAEKIQKKSKLLLVILCLLVLVVLMTVVVAIEKSK
mmetsp:Transcript_10734/g.37273  ORF Transcript_10734/g.37273 Transcript_10734/m.37273 type:complete len:220 (-) Transcript_10734:226-885(-)